MNTYDADARRLNVGTFWGNLRAALLKVDKDFPRILSRKELARLTR